LTDKYDTKLWMNFYQIIKQLNNFSLMQYDFKKISHIFFRRFLFFNSSHEEASAMKNILVTLSKLES
jgi:hypothetical protein